MRVKCLIEILQQCDPDAFVSIDLPNCRREYVERLMGTPACLLHFLIEPRSQCSYTNHPHLPAMEQVAICASLDGEFYAAEDDEGPCIGTLVAPDFRPEAN